MSTPPGDVQVRRVFLIGTPYYTNAYTGFLNGHQYAIALTFSQACPEHVKWGSCKIKEEVDMMKLKSNIKIVKGCK
eukprot:scaffold243729_cov26-Tisochrysis_lutea.AAC.1